MGSLIVEGPAIAALIGMGWYLLRSQNRHFEGLISTLESALEKIRLSAGRTTLNKEQVVKVLRDKLWFATQSKLEYIERILRENHIDTRQEQIKRQLRSELERQTRKYMGEIDEYNCGIFGLGDWAWAHFDFDPFLGEVFAVVLRPKNPSFDADQELAYKLRDVLAIEREYQNRLQEKLQHALSPHFL